SPVLLYPRSKLLVLVVVGNEDISLPVVAEHPRMSLVSVAIGAPLHTQRPLLSLYRHQVLHEVRHSQVGGDIEDANNAFLNVRCVLFVFACDSASELCLSRLFVSMSNYHHVGTN